MFQTLISASENHLVDGILDALPVQIALLEVDGRILRVNNAWRDFGAANGAADETCGPGADYLAVCDSAAGYDSVGAQAAAAGIRAVLRSEIEQFVDEYPCRSANCQRWFQLRVTPCLVHGGVGAVVMHSDVTARRSMENALRASDAAVRRLNRLHAVLSGINTLILYARSRADLFQDACRIAVEDGGFRMALILLAAPEGGSLSLAASFGVDEDHHRAVDEVLASEGGGNTMGPRALSDRTARVSNDVLNDPTLVLCDDYAARGVRSMAALPLVVEGRPLGLFVLYAADKDFFHEAEIRLLTQLGNNIAFAIDHIEKIERIEYLAYFDECTGLANRSLFLERVTARLAVAATAAEKVCVMLFDLERFKSVNDAFGREAGDSLLRQVADWVKARTGDETRVARVGPDQFAAITRQFTDRQGLAGHLAADLAAFLAHPFRLNEAVFRLAAKVGAVVWPDDATDAEGLLKHAEVALKHAKKTGGQCVVFERRMSEGAADRLALENQMRQALDKAQFVLHYQPKISLETGDLTGAEALIRWIDADGDLVMPGRFIPILEETGLIQEVGRWVLRTAVEDHLRWRAAGLSPGRVAVNVSPLQLRNHDFVAEVRSILEIDPRAALGLELEITESLIVDDITNSIKSLQALRDQGVTIAIDDFGTGSSSLSHLARLPVDTIKIDQFFTADMATGPRQLSLVSTIINLGHSLKLGVVAEGVETEEQARLLRLLGCDEMQGLLTSGALPPQMFETLYLRPRVS